MELFIIRHAQSTNNTLADERERVVDPPLTEIGRRQAELVAAYLARSTDRSSAPCEAGPPNGSSGCYFGIKKLYVSAMHRALETATAIADSLALLPEVWVDIHERGGMWLDHGAPVGIVGYPGMSRAEITARFPKVRLPDEVTDTGWYDPALRAENWTLALARAERVTSRLRNWPDPDDRIALVTHGGFGSLLLRTLVGTPPAARLGLHHDNTGITRMRFRADGQVDLRYLNRVSHLPAELIT